MNFFFDNCLSPKYASALSILSEVDGHTVKHLIEVFGKDNRSMSDEDWLRGLSQKGNWIIISGDYNIYKKPQLKKVWLECNLTTFFLHKNWPKQKFWIQAYWLIRWWPDFIAMAKRVERGTAFLVPAKPHGKLKHL